MAKYNGKVLVIGASGGVGRWVARLLKREEIPFRVLLRDPAKAGPFEKIGAEVFIGDLTSDQGAPAALAEAMKGVTAVISCLGTRQPFLPGKTLSAVDYNGTKRLVDAAKAAGTVEHYIHISTMGVAEKRSITKPFSILFYPKWQAENYLVQSGLTYSIVRPGGLIDKEDELQAPAGWQHKPAVAKATLSGEGGLPIMGRVLRQDVAEVMVKCLWLPEARNRIFDVLDESNVKTEARSKLIPNLF